MLLLLYSFQDIDTTCTELTDAGEQALLGLTGRQVIVTTNKNLQVELDQVCSDVEFCLLVRFKNFQGLFYVIIDGGSCTTVEFVCSKRAK